MCVYFRACSACVHVMDGLRNQRQLIFVHFCVYVCDSTQLGMTWLASSLAQRAGCMVVSVLYVPWGVISLLACGRLCAVAGKGHFWCA